MKYFLGFLASIGLIVVVFILVLHGFSGGKTTTGPQLSSYANTDTLVQFTLDGPINAEQQHVGYRITVSATEADIAIFSGYQSNITQSKTYVSNSAAYTSFLNALQLAGFTKGDSSPKAQTNESGYCPQGSRYTYSIINPDTSQTKQRFWSTTCGGQGTFKGNVALVHSLFEDQIPDFTSMTSQLVLNQ